MAGKAEELARQFEQKAQEATAVIEKLTDADWKKVTAAEKWSVGVTAHHVAAGHAGLAKLAKTIAEGGSVGHFTMEMLDAMNAKHAEEFAGCTRAETLALHKTNAVEAAALVRRLTDEQLARTGTVLAGRPPLSAEQIVTGILINHIDDHFGSIRRTVQG